MSKDSSTTCGMRNKHVVIIIGIFSIMQAVSYITMYITIFLQVKNLRYEVHDGEWVPSDEMFGELISIAGIIIYGLKVLMSGIVILGGVLSSPCCLVTYFITGLIGLVLTVNLGIAGLHVDWTVPISIVILSFNVTDLICLGIVLRACISMRTLKAAGEVVSTPPGSRNYPLPSPSFISRPRPPPYFETSNAPSPVMNTQYTFPPPEISHEVMLPPPETIRQYGMPGPETPSQLNASSLEMTTRFTTQRSGFNDSLNIPTAYYSPHVQRNEMEIQQSSNDVDDVSLDEPPQIYYTPVPPTQIFTQLSIENPQLRSKVVE